MDFSTEASRGTGRKQEYGIELPYKICDFIECQVMHLFYSLCLPVVEAIADQANHGFNQRAT